MGIGFWRRRLRWSLSRQNAYMLENLQHTYYTVNQYNSKKEKQHCVPGHYETYTYCLDPQNSPEYLLLLCFVTTDDELLLIFFC